MCPPYAISARRLSTKHVRNTYGANPEVLRVTEKARTDQVWEVLEYADDKVIACVLAGTQEDHYRDMGRPAPRIGVMLTMVPNRMGRSPWVYPGLINLRKTQGHFDGMLGMYQAASHLSALSTYAAFKGVMQETWLVGRQGEQPEIQNPADALTGEVGVVTGGELRNIAPDPQWQTASHLDRLMEAQRMTAGIPSDFQGMSPTNVRTGRRASQLISATTDFALQEVQEIFAGSLQKEMELMVEVDKAYLNTKKSYSLHLRGEFAEGEYKPSELWSDGNKPRVSYSMAGMDANAMVIANGQRLGAGTMSRRRVMELDPAIEDPEFEVQRIAAERIMDAQLESILVQAQSPEGPYGPEQVARLVKMVTYEGKPVYEAVLKLAEEERERQAAQVEASSPEAMPGLVPLDAEPPPMIQGPNQDQSNFGSLMSKLRLPSMTVSTPGGGRA
jgi:hypothetical protein